MVAACQIIEKNETTVVYGSSWEPLHPLLVNGLRETGDFTAIIALKADFTNETIEGCIGCVENQETTGVTLRPEGEQSELYTNLSLVSIKFAPVPIQQTIFRGSRLLGVIGDEGLGIDFPTEENKGNWGGRFSDRLVAGTFGIEWTKPGWKPQRNLGQFLRYRGENQLVCFWHGCLVQRLF